MRRLIGLVAAAAAMGAAAAPAGAAEVVYADDAEVPFLGVLGRDDGNDQLNVFLDGSTIVFSVFYSDGDGFAPGSVPAGCTIAAGTKEARCDLAAFPEARAVAALGGGGDDVINGSSDPDKRVTVPFLADGGAGADTIQGGVHHNLIDGGADADKLKDTAGTDQLYGGPGDDELQSLHNDGADLFDGGDGTDTAYFIRNREFTVTLNGIDDDGVAGEKDDVRAENLSVEGSGATFVGDDGPNVFRSAAYGGQDGRSNTFVGGGGNDKLFGGGGTDVLDGGPGDDELLGSDGNDVLDGGSGIDSFVGDDLDANFMRAPGDDVIRARDGNQETISCGLGADRAEVDANDVVTADGYSVCEALDRPATPGPGPGPVNPNPGPVPPKLSLGAAGVGLEKVKRDRRAPFVFRLRGKLAAPASHCAGSTVKLLVRRGRKLVLGRNVQVGADCRWRSTLKLGRRKGRYSLTVSFPGGPKLEPGKARKVTLRAG